MSSTTYNPIPTRFWSRVQTVCTNDELRQSEFVYLPLSNRTIPRAQAIIETQMLIKGNVLQYKKNSSSLTKKQRYSQICKGAWTNRTKNYATQSQTYTNPNTNSLLRVNSVDLQVTPSGIYQYDIKNPFNCPLNSIQEGGNLICNTTVNPCTNQIIQQTKVNLCFPTSSSNVPGRVIDLCWNPKVDTWYAKPRRTMNNSGNKWPINYKGLISACQPKL